MPKPNNKKIDDVKGAIQNEPELNDFISHPVPSQKEVVKIEQTMEKEVKETEIDESLSEIYQDDEGDGLVDVSRLSVKKSNIFSWIFGFLFIFGLAGGSLYAAYNFIYLGVGNDNSSVEFKIEGKEEVIAGEEFIYTLTYNNPSRLSLKNAVINIKYPDSFILLDTEENTAKGTWQFDTIQPNFTGTIKIKGKIVAKKDSSGIALASFTYTPSNFSSEFKKESSFVTLVNDIGLQIDTDYPTPVLAGEESNLLLKVKPKDKSFIKNFRINIDPLENIEFLNIEESENKFKMIRGGVYEITLTEEDVEEFSIPFKFTEKINEKEDFVLSLAQIDEGGVTREFYNTTLPIEIINSDLNLTMIVNGSKVDNGIDFGGTLNYSLVFDNKGETDLKDVVIMAVLESDLLDWSTLVDEYDGSKKSGTISWTKNEIKALADLSPRDEGTIDFSIQVENPTEISSDVDYSIKAYAQYSIGTSTQDIKVEKSDLRSNMITTSINSNLSFNESLKYFNDDNLAVGSGPLPPKVGETTSLRVYWEINNGLHDLEKLFVTTKLPDYVTYVQGENLSQGNIEYNPQTRNLTWLIENLPISTEKVTADFKINVVPRAEDAGKILVVLNGTTITANDKVTGELLQKKSSPKTSRLEDDTVANINGIIQ